jgi:CBS domain-containing protein
MGRSQTQEGGDIMQVNKLMTTKVATCRPDTNLAVVAKLMWDRDCGFVPVVEASGKVAGVITDRDICIASATRRLLPEQITAAQAMSRGIQSCQPDNPIGDALATMKKFRVRRLPVVAADGALKGVISINDIVLGSEQRDGPVATDIVSTMAAICAHRSVPAAAA